MLTSCFLARKVCNLYFTRNDQCRQVWLFRRGRGRRRCDIFDGVVRALAHTAASSARCAGRRARRAGTHIDFPEALVHAARLARRVLDLRAVCARARTTTTTATATAAAATTAARARTRARAPSARRRRPRSASCSTTTTRTTTTSPAACARSTSPARPPPPARASTARPASSTAAQRSPTASRPPRYERAAAAVFV